jgi:hypothetical protein
MASFASLSQPYNHTMFNSRLFWLGVSEKGV